MLRKLTDLIGRKKMGRVGILLVVMFIGSLLEMMGISLIVSVCSLMMDTQRVMSNRVISWLCGWTGIQPGRELLTALVLFLMFLYLFKMVYLLAESYALARFVHTCRHDVASRLYEATLRAPYEFFISSSAADVINLSNDAGRFASCLDSALQVLTECLVMVCIGTFLLFINPVMTAFAGAGIVLLLFLIRGVIKKRAYQLGVRLRAAGQRRLKWLGQAVHGVKDVKMSQTEDFFLGQYTAADGEYSRVDYTSQVWRRLPSLCIEAVMVVCILLYILVLVLSGRNMPDYFPSLSALALVTVRLLPACSRINSGLTQLSYTKSSLESIEETLSRLEETRAAQAGQDRETALTQAVRAEGVTYCYPQGTAPVLEKADIEIPIGSSVGIVGASGAGKTTLVDILLGLLTPQEGTVTADGIPLADCQRSYLEKVSYIPQNIFLLDDTVRNNVALGIAPEAIEDEAVWAALDKASLGDMVRALRQKLDTPVGENGIRLSGGERQRLGIARALYQGGVIMVFDEATSALDPETEAAIIQSIHSLRGEKTTVIISHRQSAVQRCDRIYRVEGGTVRRVV